MLTLSIPLSIIGLSVFCWLLYSLAIYALPFFIGLSITFYAFQSGAGGLGAIMLGVITGGAVLALFHMAVAWPRSLFLRIVLAMIFVVPAAIAGYYVTFALAGSTFPSELWRQIFALIGAVTIGVTAWQRLAPMPTSRCSHRMPAGS